MRNIQELINQKAERIVEEKLHEFFKACQNIGIHNIKGKVEIEGVPNPDSIWRAFASNESDIKKELKKRLLESEIKIQSKLFYDKVNQLHSEVTNLLGDYIQQDNEEQF